MSCFCFGGICVPYTAVFTFLLIVLKWVADKTGLLGLLPESITKRLGLAGICNDDCCKVPSNIDMNKVGEVTDIRSEEEWATVKKDHKVIVAKFTASWCKPCKGRTHTYPIKYITFRPTFFLKLRMCICLYVCYHRIFQFVKSNNLYDPSFFGFFLKWQ